MKLAYINWHQEPVHDDMVKNELAIISDGAMKFEGGGYKIHFDPRSNFPNKGNNNNRNFKNKNNRKGGGPGGTNNNSGGNRNNNNNNNNNNKNRNFKNK
jgi:hypothetical protein